MAREDASNGLVEFGEPHGLGVEDVLDGEVEIDARPSDALALALRAKASIYVAPEVMETAGLRLDDAGRPGKPESAQSRVEDLKRKLEKAVEDERYEDAARLRDQIQKLTQTN